MYHFIATTQCFIENVYNLSNDNQSIHGCVDYSTLIGQLQHSTVYYFSITDCYHGYTSDLRRVGPYKSIFCVNY